MISHPTILPISYGAGSGGLELYTGDDIYRYDTDNRPLENFAANDLALHTALMEVIGEIEQAYTGIDFSTGDPYTYTSLDERLDAIEQWLNETSNTGTALASAFFNMAAWVGSFIGSGFGDGPFHANFKRRSLAANYTEQYMPPNYGSLFSTEETPNAVCIETRTLIETTPASIPHFVRRPLSLVIGGRPAILYNAHGGANNTKYEEGGITVNLPAVGNSPALDIAFLEFFDRPTSDSGPFYLYGSKDARVSETIPGSIDPYDTPVMVVEPGSVSCTLNITDENLGAISVDIVDNGDGTFTANNIPSGASFSTQYLTFDYTSGNFDYSHPGSTTTIDSVTYLSLTYAATSNSDDPRVALSIGYDKETKTYYQFVSQIRVERFDNPIADYPNGFSPDNYMYQIHAVGELQAPTAETYERGTNYINDGNVWVIADPTTNRILYYAVPLFAAARGMSGSYSPSNPAGMADRWDNVGENDITPEMVVDLRPTAVSYSGRLVETLGDMSFNKLLSGELHLFVDGPYYRLHDPGAPSPIRYSASFVPVGADVTEAWSISSDSNPNTYDYYNYVRDIAALEAGLDPDRTIRGNYRRYFWPVDYAETVVEVLTPNANFNKPPVHYDGTNKIYLNPVDNSVPGSPLTILDTSYTPRLIWAKSRAPVALAPNPEDNNDLVWSISPDGKYMSCYIDTTAGTYDATDKMLLTFRIVFPASTGIDRPVKYISASAMYYAGAWELEEYTNRVYSPLPTFVPDINLWPNAYFMPTYGRVTQDDQHILLSDTGNSRVVFAAVSDLTKEIGYPSNPWDPNNITAQIGLRVPLGVDFYPGSSVPYIAAVADAGTHTVHILSFLDTATPPSHLTQLGTFDVSGSDSSHFDSPSAVAYAQFSTRTVLFVGDSGNRRIVMYEANGNSSYTRMAEESIIGNTITGMVHDDVRQRLYVATDYGIEIYDTSAIDGGSWIIVYANMPAWIEYPVQLQNTWQIEPVGVNKLVISGGSSFPTGAPDNQPLDAQSAYLAIISTDGSEKTKILGRGGQVWDRDQENDPNNPYRDPMYHIGAVPIAAYNPDSNLIYLLSSSNRQAIGNGSSDWVLNIYDADNLEYRNQVRGGIWTERTPVEIPNATEFSSIGADPGPWIITSSVSVTGQVLYFTIGTSKYLAIQMAPNVDWWVNDGYHAYWDAPGDFFKRALLIWDITEDPANPSTWKIISARWGGLRRGGINNVGNNDVPTASSGIIQSPDITATDNLDPNIDRQLSQLAHFMFWNAEVGSIDLIPYGSTNGIRRVDMSNFPASLSTSYISLYATTNSSSTDDFGPFNGEDTIDYSGLRVISSGDIRYVPSGLLPGVVQDVMLVSVPRVDGPLNTDNRYTAFYLLNPADGTNILGSGNRVFADDPLKKNISYDPNDIASGDDVILIRGILPMPDGNFYALYLSHGAWDLNRPWGDFLDNWVGVYTKPENFTQMPADYFRNQGYVRDLSYTIGQIFWAGSSGLIDNFLPYGIDIWTSQLGNSILYAVDPMGNRLAAFDVDTGALVGIVQSAAQISGGVASINSPLGIAVTHQDTANRKLFIIDTHAHRLLKKFYFVPIVSEGTGALSFLQPPPTAEEMVFLAVYEPYQGLRGRAEGIQNTHFISGKDLVCNGETILVTTLGKGPAVVTSNTGEAGVYSGCVSRLPLPDITLNGSALPLEYNIRPASLIFSIGGSLGLHVSMHKLFTSLSANRPIAGIAENRNMWDPASGLTPYSSLSYATAATGLPSSPFIEGTAALSEDAMTTRVVATYKVVNIDGEARLLVTTEVRSDNQNIVGGGIIGWDIFPIFGKISIRTKY